MKLYEVNLEIEALLSQLEPDPETGEVPANEEEIIKRLNELALRREDILCYLAKLALDAGASIQALRTEEKRLHERRSRVERRRDHLLSILDRECAGQKTDLGVATLSYRQSTHVEIRNLKAAYDWLKRKGYDTCYRMPEPELRKAEIGRLLDQGEIIDGVERISSVSCCLR